MVELSKMEEMDLIEESKQWYPRKAYSENKEGNFQNIPEPIGFGRMEPMRGDKTMIEFDASTQWFSNHHNFQPFSTIYQKR